MSSHMAGRLPLSSPLITDLTAHHPFLDSTGSSGSLASLHIAVLPGVHLGAWISLNESQRILLWLWAFKAKGWPHKTVGIWEEMERMSVLVPATWASWLPKLQMRLTATAAAGLKLSNGNLLQPLDILFHDAEHDVFIKQPQPVLRNSIVDIFAHPKIWVDTWGCHKMSTFTCLRALLQSSRIACIT